MIGTISSCGENMIESEKQNKKIQSKYIWEKIDVIPLLPLLGVNHRQPLIRIPKRRFIFIQLRNKLINLQLVI